MPGEEQRWQCLFVATGDARQLLFESFLEKQFLLQPVATRTLVASALICTPCTCCSLWSPHGCDGECPIICFGPAFVIIRSHAPAGRYYVNQMSDPARSASFMPFLFLVEGVKQDDFLLTAVMFRAPFSHQADRAF